MNKKYMIWLSFLLSLLAICCWCRPALADQEVTIQLTNQTAQDVGQVSYRLWKLSSEEASRDKESLKKELDQRADSNWEEQGSRTGLVDDQGRVSIQLADGLYYARAYRKGSPAQDIVSFLLEIPMQDGNIVRPKRQFIRGRLKVFKYEVKSGQKIPLQGVTFSIYQLGDLQFTRIKDGEFTTDSNGTTILTTDEHGEILVSGLLPGDYRLREQRPLAGFDKLTEDISFSIIGEVLVVKEVENHRSPPLTPPSTEPPKPTPPPKPKPPTPKPKLPPFLPSTGTEMVAWVSMLGGAIGFIALTIRKKGKKSD